MIPIDTLILFLSASIALALAPGPDNIFVLTQSALYGRKAGLLITLGLCTGLIGHTTAVILGVATLFQTSALAFTLLKTLGAVYLAYLAVQAWHAGNQPIETSGEELSNIQLYRRGIIMNISNPKVAIFFLAFLPQFTHPEAGSLALQMLTLAALFTVSGFAVFAIIATAAGSLGSWLRKSSKAQKTINKLASLIFIALALRLVLVEA